MKSTAESPFGFLEWYLRKQIDLDLKEFYINITEETYYNEVKDIDEETHKIKVLNTIHRDEIDSEYLTYTFEGFIRHKLIPEIEYIVRLLEFEFQKRFSDKKELMGYADFLRIKIKHIQSQPSFKHFPFLKTYTTKIEDTINRYSSKMKTYSFTPSFNLLAQTEIEQKDKIDKLYELLTEAPSLINCTRSEFSSAFSGGEIIYGVHWLVIGKNKNVSKTSLFYFIDKLIDEKHLDRDALNYLNKMVSYTFRDNYGKELQNLKQSKATIYNNPAQKDRIDRIISSL